jgi:hypothetical protein
MHVDVERIVQRERRSPARLANFLGQLAAGGFG